MFEIVPDCVAGRLSCDVCWTMWRRKTENQRRRRVLVALYLTSAPRLLRPNNSLLHFDEYIHKRNNRCATAATLAFISSFIHTHTHTHTAPTHPPTPTPRLDLHVHSMHPGVHVVQPRCPRRPCRPRPHHCAFCTFSDMEHCAHGTHGRTVSMRTIVARSTPVHSSFVQRRRHDAPCAGAHTCAHEPHRTARPARRARAMAVPAAPCPCAPSVPRCFYFWRKTDFACQDLSAAAEKRARWSCRWHPTTAGPMDDCCPLLLAALARAGRAGAHSSVPTPWNPRLR
jgi:hypothetical protein